MDFKEFVTDVTIEYLVDSSGKLPNEIKGSDCIWDYIHEMFDLNFMIAEIEVEYEPNVVLADPYKSFSVNDNTTIDKFIDWCVNKKNKDV